jgi:hypothetical protein
VRSATRPATRVDARDPLAVDARRVGSRVASPRAIRERMARASSTSRTEKFWSPRKFFIDTPFQYARIRATVKRLARCNTR